MTRSIEVGPGVAGAGEDKTAHVSPKVSSWQGSWLKMKLHRKGRTGYPGFQEPVALKVTCLDSTPSPEILIRGAWGTARESVSLKGLGTIVLRTLES